MQFLAAQIGARRNYAVPLLLEKAGLLERFYTDVCADAGLGAGLVKAGQLLGLSGKLRGLSSRKLPAEIRAKTFTFGSPTLRHHWRLAMDAREPRGCFCSHVQRDRELGKAMAKAGFGNATHLYSMLGECAPLVEAATDRGVKVISEIYTLMGLERILEEERKLFPDWEPARPNYEKLLKEFGAAEVLFTCTNHFICPSEGVRDDLVANWAVASESISVVPYGVDARFFAVENRPVRGRVLFVGAANLNKGFHYYAIATARLSQKGYDFRVAGSVRPEVARRSECRHVNFIGRVPRSEMTSEYGSAQVFVLPSLAEGSSEATYEALACGLPVITTKASGSVVRHGIEGLVVPERDPVALAEAIERIVSDRGLRDQMAANARVRARDYTWDRYGERLLSALHAQEDTA
jgi:glycosyltransferase involved in cell wall biosynthesis